MFRRKQLPERLLASWTVFAAQALRVEDARKALLGCLPVGRVDPMPIPVGIDLLADELQAVRDELERWRVPGVEAQWQRCRGAIDEALAAVGPAHQIAASTAELEVLLEAVADIVEPLDVWQDAERAWRALRTR